MPANYQKIVNILFAEIDGIEERCDDYHAQLKHTVSEVITLVREHKLNRTNVDQKVSDQISATGRFLDDCRKASKKERQD